MKTFLISALVAAGLMAGGTAQASDGPMCLQAYLVDHTHVVNASTIDFYLRGGKVLRSHLATPCSGLNFHGFKVIGHEGEICAPGGISVLVSSQICELGRFEPVQNPSKTPM
ncbi:MAG TPA: hypothetical protein VG309_04530 [Rhizomicrobium sp.]|jgi:hypothetical protein|nr:hypothetical protein [Rhizomicrobium sp.]